MSESLYVPVHLKNPQFRKTLDTKVEESDRRTRKPDSSRPGCRPLKDRWFRLDLNERDRLIRENAEQITMLESLSYSGTAAAADKLLAANVWKKMGLFNNFAAIRDAMFEAERRRRPGRKPDAGEIYRAIATEFKAGKWADHASLLARMEEKDEADRAATLEELTAELLTATRSRNRGPTYSQTEIVEWVSEHFLDDVGSLKAEEVPNAAALSMLLWAKKNESSFRRLYHRKLLPSVAQVKKRATFGNDGRTTVDIINNLLKGRERARGNGG